MFCITLRKLRVQSVSASCPLWAHTQEISSGTEIHSPRGDLSNHIPEKVTQGGLSILEVQAKKGKAHNLKVQSR